MKKDEWIRFAVVVAAGALVVNLWHLRPTDPTTVAAGIAAYDRGDGASALKILEPLASNGSAEAQYYLGRLYDNETYLNQEPNGPHNVFYDYSKAANWYSLAAEQSNVLAQANLGRMYFYGHGVQQDSIKAYMWINLATTGSKDSGLDAHKKLLNFIAAQMTADQIAEAERLRVQWLSTARGEKKDP